MPLRCELRIIFSSVSFYTASIELHVIVIYTLRSVTALRNLRCPFSFVLASELLSLRIQYYNIVLYTNIYLLNHHTIVPNIPNIYILYTSELLILISADNQSSLKRTIWTFLTLTDLHRPDYLHRIAALLLCARVRMCVCNPYVLPIYAYCLLLYVIICRGKSRAANRIFLNKFVR